MKTATRSKYPNRWERPDERSNGLLEIAWSIEDGSDFAGCPDQAVGEDGRPIMPPRELAKRMRESADRIDALTGSEDK